MRATRNKYARHFRHGVRLEHLEERTLLAISLQGIPDYTQQGPGPIVGGQAGGDGRAAAAGA